MRGRRRGRGLAVATLTFLAFALLFHELGRHLLAEVGVVELLLSAGAAESLVLAVVAALFMVLRLFIIVAAPGLAIIALAKLLRPRRPRSGTPSAQGENRP